MAETETETDAVSARSVYTLHVANVSCMQSHTLLRHILSPGISCRRQQYICQRSRHIVVLAVTDGLFGRYGSERVHELFISTRSPLPSTLFPSLISRMVSVDVKHHVSGCVLFLVIWCVMCAWDVQPVSSYSKDLLQHMPCCAFFPTNNTIIHILFDNVCAGTVLTR